MGAWTRGRNRLGIVGALGLLLALLLPAAPARAATLLVNTLADDDGGSASNCTAGTGTCTLRGALAAAHNGDTIEFSVAGTIPLSNGTLTVGTNVTVQGPGAGTLAVSGEHAATVFQVNSGVQATFAGLTIENGQAILGAASRIAAP